MVDALVDDGRGADAAHGEPVRQEQDDAGRRGADDGAGHGHQRAVRHGVVGPQPSVGPVRLAHRVQAHGLRVRSFFFIDISRGIEMEASSLSLYLKMSPLLLCVCVRYV